MGDPIRFRGQIQYFDSDAGKGLAIVLIPDELVEQLGGLKQHRVRGTVNGAAFTASTMARRPRRLCVSLNKATLIAGGLHIGDLADVTLERHGSSP